MKATCDISRTRKASSIQDEYLKYDYEWPVAIARIIDSRGERFELGNLYRDRYPVVNFITHPEIEMLAIVREGKFDEYTRIRKSSFKPSDYCKTVLGMRQIKSEKISRGLLGCGGPCQINKGLCQADQKRASREAACRSA